MTERTAAFSVQFGIPAKNVADLFISAFETPTGSWFRNARPSAGTKEIVIHLLEQPGAEAEPWYSVPAIYDPTWNGFDPTSGKPHIDEAEPIMMVTCDDPDADGTLTKPISRNTIAHALGIMADSDAGRRHIFALLEENDDAETADVFLQVCLFGDIIYG